ncbi:putative 1,3-beta-glucan synthase [Dioscorea sansibarensis]
MDEIEVVSEAPLPDQASTSSPRPSRSYETLGHAHELFDSEKVPSSLVPQVRRFLRVANQIQSESPRLAYLCRVHAFTKVHFLDPNSSGRGVRQFKTTLLQRLEQDEHTIPKHEGKSDVRELKSFHLKMKDANEQAVASVLLEVLRAIMSEAGFETFDDAKASKASFASNILPLDSGGSQHAIMHLPEIKAALSAVRNVQGLPMARSREETGGYVDLLDFLECLFGFQSGNVANQREHLTLLLANIQARQKPISMSKLGDKAVDELMIKLFNNYMNWCNFLGRTINIWLPSIKQQVQQYKLLYIGLYLLIWGEAANLRLMPECLCYIFHYMAYDLYGFLSGSVNLKTGEKVIPAYGGEPESFLKNVVTPIYTVIFKEARKSKNGTSDHSTWRNYDDLNEYFWSIDCFKLGWPIKLDADFFYTLYSEDGIQKSQATINEEHEQQEVRKWLGKTNFVEVRSFWHLFRSFDRMWTFFILVLQAMIIVACHDLETPVQLLDSVIFNDILSIFITNAFLRFIQVTLDIIFTWKTWKTMSFTQKLRFAVKFVIAAAWTITLPVSYASSTRNCSETSFDDFCLSTYVITVGIYLASNVIGSAFFLVPAVTNYIETSNWCVCKFLSWYAQPQLYIGRGMQESQVSLLKYTIFWLILLSSKILFSYHFEIKPVVESTKQIMKISVNNYEWHELFPRVKHNAGAILAVWAPIILVYFMDTQIWYSIFCTIFGGFYGIFHHLGEIRTMGMVKSRFHTLPSVFSVHLVPPTSHKQRKKNLTNFLKNKIFKMNLMMMPLSVDMSPSCVHWPLFLLATKFSTAMNMGRDFVGKYEQLLRKIEKDKYMCSAIQECYHSLKYILNALVVGELEKRVIDAVFSEVEKSIKSCSLLEDFNLHELPALHDKLILLVKMLFENEQAQRDDVIILLQDILELLVKDVMNHGNKILDLINGSQIFEEPDVDKLIQYPPDLFTSNVSDHVICFPLPCASTLKEKIQRLFLLLTVKDTAMNIPTNLEARRRISFFATSLFMDMPAAPKVRNMFSFSVMTPYYMEEVKFSEDELHSSQDGASILSYMQKIYPDEWKNFQERLGSSASDEEEIRYWASFRGQTLSRTVRGMMYYMKALRWQVFLDMASDQDVIERHNAVEREHSKKSNRQTLAAQLDALVNMKFTYVISCQKYGEQKASGAPHAKDIIDLMTRYPYLRVAYIEEKEEMINKMPHKVYSSVLIKAENNLDQEVYRIKLPGPPIIGEGKPENQNHAIIFTRGEALQTIDMNQDNYLEETFKMRNVLQEFLGHNGDQPPTIIGLREHIFTGSVSSLAGFMSSQETSFVTIGQRFLTDPLRVRFHYGHPDLFDRVFHLTRGGISKASKTINLSEDVFAGFNSTLRQGYVTYKEYMQVGKGRDVGLNQISKFEAKVANGNSEQILSRDIYRLGRRFDFYRMLSCYFTTVGFYVNSLISILGVYVFLYGQLYLVLSGVEKALINEARSQNIKSLETALASQSFLQLGLLSGLPMFMELGLEKGFRMAVSDFILMQLQLASVFFTFSLGTKSHYFGRTILHGGAKYRPTGRKFVVFHSSFSENYQLYSRSHFVKGFEMLFLLIVYNMFRRSYQSSMAYLFATYSIWFMTFTWLFAPFLFNPSGFAWQKVVEDWKDWNKWMNNQGGIGVQPDKSWESWWNEEQAHLRHSGLTSQILEMLLSLRFFIYQYGLVYHLDIAQENKNFLVYVLSWVVIVAIFLLVKVLVHSVSFIVVARDCAVAKGREQLSTRFHLLFRLFKVLIFLSILTCIVTLSNICKLSMTDLVICCLAFIPTGWGLLLISQVLRFKLEQYWIWESIQVIAQAYDYAMGSLIFAPIAALSWMPVISAIQTRVLFNQAFNRQLQIQPILAWKSKKK